METTNPMMGDFSFSQFVHCNRNMIHLWQICLSRLFWLSSLFCPPPPVGKTKVTWVTLVSAMARVACLSCTSGTGSPTIGGHNIQ